MSKVVIAETEGLTLTLTFDGDNLNARLAGGGLVAETTAGVEREALARFFADAVTLKAPTYGRWEYKASDDAIVLHAEPVEEDKVLLAIILLASSLDNADWQADGTITVSASTWAAIAREVAAITEAQQ
jgi:hypothetical protein